MYNKTKIFVPEKHIYQKAIDHLYNDLSEEIKAIFLVDDPKKVMNGVWPHMLKFEAFGMEQYNRVVFYDSDMLFVGDIKEAFFNDYDFIICDDRTERAPYNENDKRRRQPAFNLNLGIRKYDNITYLNSGFFSVKSPKKEYVQELIDIAEHYKITGTFFWGACCEQDAINIFLWDKNAVLFGMQYNAVQFHYNDRYNRKITSEKAIHYITSTKPWLDNEAETIQNDYISNFQNKYIKSLWRDELKYVDNEIIKLFGCYNLLKNKN